MACRVPSNLPFLLWRAPGSPAVGRCKSGILCKFSAEFETWTYSLSSFIQRKRKSPSANISSSVGSLLFVFQNLSNTKLRLKKTPRAPILFIRWYKIVDRKKIGSPMQTSYVTEEFRLRPRLLHLPDGIIRIENGISMLKALLISCVDYYV
jgi:hypothetical protein